MKNSKTCPKCSSTEIYSDFGVTKRGDRSILPVSNWSNIYVDVYACMDCGFFEEYISTKNKDTLEKLKSSWKKV
jgi:predicted nucleic-acid-binding Zn-ribbon protein